MRLIMLAALLVVAGGAIAADLPDPALTPGVVRNLSVKKICATKWGTDRRLVTARMKRKVFADYKMTQGDCVPDAPGRQCEIDHLIPRSIGGADDVRNLWPQSYGGHPWNAVIKDRLESRLHRDVCSGKIKLKSAQDAFRGDYRLMYRALYGEPK